MSLLPWPRCLRALLLGAGLCALLPLCASGQALSPPSPTPPPTPDRWVPSLRSIGQDAIAIVRAPFDLSPSQQFMTLGATGLVASTAAALDRPAYRGLHVRSGPLADVSGPLATPGRWYDRAGPDQVALGTAGLLAAGGLVLRRQKWTRTSVRVVEALVFTKLVTGLAKSAINRSRPYSNPDPLMAAPGTFSGTHSKLSMPSGHTARAFAVASVLSHQFDHWYVSVPAYGVAGSVALERVRSGDHWLTDVFVGGALGYLIGRTVSAAPSPGDLNYTPILGTDRIGLSVRF